MMKILPCKKICHECGFSKLGTKNTLYAESFEIIERGIIFPCHMYLKAHTGSENKGVEQLNEIHVCRGYVAYMKLYHNDIQLDNGLWTDLFDKLDERDLIHIYTPDELLENHKALRDNIYLEY